MRFRRSPNAERQPPAEVYTGLRQQVLSLTSDQLGDELADVPILALLMETGYPEAVATLVAVVDGTSSLYFSCRGGPPSLRPLAVGALTARSAATQPVCKVRSFSLRHDSSGASSRSRITCQRIAGSPAMSHSTTGVGRAQLRRFGGRVPASGHGAMFAVRRRTRQ